MEIGLEVLFSRLVNKNLSAIEIKRLVKDVHYITRDNKALDVAAVNNKLVNLGWPKDTVDEFTFELIRFVLDDQGMLKIDENRLKTKLPNKYRCSAGGFQ